MACKRVRNSFSRQELRFAGEAGPRAYGLSRRFHVRPCARRQQARWQRAEGSRQCQESRGSDAEGWKASDGECSAPAREVAWLTAAPTVLAMAPS